MTSVSRRGHPVLAATPATASTAVPITPSIGPFATTLIAAFAPAVTGVPFTVPTAASATSVSPTAPSTTSIVHPAAAPPAIPATALPPVGLTAALTARNGSERNGADDAGVP